MHFYSCRSTIKIKLTDPNFSTLELNKLEIYDFPLDKARAEAAANNFSRFNSSTLRLEDRKAASRWWNILWASTRWMEREMKFIKIYKNFSIAQIRKPAMETVGGSLESSTWRQSRLDKLNWEFFYMKKNQNDKKTPQIIPTSTSLKGKPVRKKMS